MFWKLFADDDSAGYMMSAWLLTWPRPKPCAASCAIVTATSCGLFAVTCENAKLTSVAVWLPQSSGATPAAPWLTPMFCGEPPMNDVSYRPEVGRVVTTCTLNGAKYCCTSEMVCDFCDA